MTIDRELGFGTDFITWRGDVLTRRKGIGGRGSQASYLFKYYSPDSAYTLPNLRSILVNSKMRFSGRREFNDPFDSYVRVAPPSRAEGHDYARSLFLRKFERDAVLAEAAAGAMVSNPDWYDGVCRARERVLDRAGIICFAESASDMLMWSHYGGSHRGVAVVFKLIAEKNAFLNAAPICYGDTFPSISFAASIDPEKWTRTLYYKHSGWRYEYEWRLLGANMAGEYCALRPDVVDGLIFGALADDKFKAEVFNVLRDRKKAGHSDLELHQLSLRTDEFGLQHQQFHIAI